ncbi:hypothetical protein [Paracoccus sp. Ld10]|uniref:hypothetical protein n=1 Tax=Paracoccus sp. Ld10 TaxID=649158 RepID=UPI0038705559
MTDNDALAKLKNAVRQEIKNENTKEADKARYEAANDTLLEAVDCGGGFADALANFLNRVEENPVIDLIRKADPENRAALLEVLGSFPRFGIAPKIEARFPRGPHFV